MCSKDEAFVGYKTLIIERLKQKQEGIEMSRVSAIRYNELDQICDIAGIKVDTTLPKDERIRRYIGEVGNPYLCRVGDTIVEIKFSNSDTPIQDRINSLVDSSMRS